LVNKGTNLVEEHVVIVAVWLGKA